MALIALALSTPIRVILTGFECSESVGTASVVIFMAGVIIVLISFAPRSTMKHMPGPGIPQGWELLKPDEVAIKDVHFCRHSSRDEWEVVAGFHGTRADFSSSWQFIKPAQPKPDPDWLNPWD
jgi:hypothetical protein